MKKKVSNSEKAVPVGKEKEKIPATVEDDVPEEEDHGTEGDAVSQAPANQEASQTRPRSKQQRAGIIFPILRIRNSLRKGKLVNSCPGLSF